MSEPATPQKQCLACGSRTVRLRRRPGRTIQYRNLMAMPIPPDFPIPMCGRCYAEFLEPETARALDATLSELYTRELRRLATAAIGKLRACVTQHQLELMIGLSKGYLSHIKVGHPSPPLVLLLVLLAHDPTVRLGELRDVLAGIAAAPQSP